MIKRILYIALLIATALAFTGCGGGGSDSSAPVGVNPGVASRVELMATSYVNQTNSYCFFKTKVIDGNGIPIPNIEVIYTNLSLTGVLDHTTAVTGANGIATATLYSTTFGFATVQSEVNTGTEKIRDKKTVFFSPFDVSFPPGGGVVIPDLTSLTLDSDNFILFETPTDTDANITATVTDSTGAPLLNSEVTFGADSPAVTFPLGSDPNAPVVHTNAAGQATVLARVSPLILNGTDTTVNITASAVIDATTTIGNVLTLFLRPVTVTSVVLTPSPASVPSGGTSTITAVVNTTAGLAPDGTNVNFRVTNGVGAIPPFSATTGGVATATYTAPTVTINTSGTISATAGGSAPGTTTVNIIAPVITPPTPPAPDPLVVTPTLATLSCLNGSAAIFIISGGTPPYTVQAAVTPAPVTITPGGGQFTVRANACTAGQPESQVINVLVSDNSSPRVVVAIEVTVTNP